MGTKEAYRFLARMLHPDRGGSTEAMQHLNELNEAAREGGETVVVEREKIVFRDRSRYDTSARAILDNLEDGITETDLNTLRRIRELCSDDVMRVINRTIDKAGTPRLPIMSDGSGYFNQRGERVKRPSRQPAPVSAQCMPVSSDVNDVRNIYAFTEWYKRSGLAGKAWMSQWSDDDLSDAMQQWIDTYYH